jgi:hypothetical protein
VPSPPVFNASAPPTSLAPVHFQSELTVFNATVPNRDSMPPPKIERAPLKSVPLAAALVCTLHHPSFGARTSAMAMAASRCRRPSRGRDGLGDGDDDDRSRFSKTSIDFWNPPPPQILSFKFKPILLVFVNFGETGRDRF